MRFSWALWVIACVCLWAAASPLRAQTPDAPVRALEDLDLALAKAQIEAKIPGLSIVVIEGGQPVLTKAYGAADASAKILATTATLFRAGSISKSFVALAVMMLVEEGKLSLDAKLSDLVPELKQVNPWEREAPVRLAHLLEHTSGWQDLTLREFARGGRKRYSLFAALADTPGKARKARYRPGRFYSYSSVNTTAAALMVERAAGMAFEDFVRIRIFASLQMASATYNKPDTGFARAHNADGTSTASYTEISDRPAGAIIITAGDLARLPLLMLGRGTLDGVTLISPQSAERIEQTQTTDASRAGLGIGYGLANFGWAGPKGVFRGHDGAIDSYQSVAAYSPGQGRGYVAMANGGSLNAAVALIEAFLTRDRPAAAPSQPPSAPDALKSWEGFYRPLVHRYDLAAPFDDFMGLMRVSFENGVLKLNGEAWTFLGDNKFARVGQTQAGAAFLESPEGTLLVQPLATFRRVPMTELVWQGSWTFAFLGALGFALIHAIVWLIGFLRGGHKHRGGLGLRLLPPLALLVLIALPVTLVIMASTDPIERLGRETNWSLSLFALSCLVPIAGFLSFWRGLTAGYGAPYWLRAYAMLSGALVLIAAWVLWNYGWIGLKTWAL